MDLTLLPLWARLTAVVAVVIGSVGVGMFHVGAGLIAVAVGCLGLLVSNVDHERGGD